MGGDQLLDDGDDGIIGPGAAENHLIGRIIEPEARAERLFAEIVDAADGPHQGDAGRIWPARQRRAPRGLARRIAMRDADEIEDHENEADDARPISNHHIVSPQHVSAFKRIEAGNGRGDGRKYPFRLPIEILAPVNCLCRRGWRIAVELPIRLGYKSAALGQRRACRRHGRCPARRDPWKSDAFRESHTHWHTVVGDQRGRSARPARPIRGKLWRLPSSVSRPRRPDASISAMPEPRS